MSKKRPLRPHKPSTQPKHVHRVARVIWTKPHPNSVYKLAADAMRRANNIVLESAMRRLARAEANGLDRLITKQDVIEWLDEHIEQAHYLKHLIEERLESDTLQAHLQAELPPDSRRQCGYCEEWFVPERSTGRFCSVRCRVANHRRKRRGQPF